MTIDKITSLLTIKFMTAIVMSTTKDENAQLINRLEKDCSINVMTVLN